MDIDFLPKKYQTALAYLDLEKLSEIRMRLDFPITCIYDFKKVYLSERGITLFSDKSIICLAEDIKEVINYVTEYSIYAHNEKIRQGFITTKSGMRIGLGGECVFDNNQVVTLKNVSSLNIRFAKEIKNCADKIIEYVCSGKKIYNSLIISPPAFGKTTILKDIAIKLNDTTNYSILIIDERGEFESIKGVNIDKISYSDKLYGLTCGVRTLSPNVVITDELMSEKDWLCAQTAVNCGVKIIASVHGRVIGDVIGKRGFVKDVFERYVLLDDLSLKPGVLKDVFNGDYVKV